MKYRIILFDPDEEGGGSQEMNLLEFDAKNKKDALCQFEDFKTSFRNSVFEEEVADDLELYRMDVIEKKTKIV